MIDRNMIEINELSGRILSTDGFIRRMEATLNELNKNIYFDASMSIHITGKDINIINLEKDDVCNILLKTIKEQTEWVTKWRNDLKNL